MSTKRIRVGGADYIIEPRRYILVVQATIDSTGSGEAVFEAPEDILVEEILAYSEDAGGLATCRIGWKSDAGRDEDFYAPEKNATLRYPIAATLFSDASIYKTDKWLLIFPKGKKRQFIFQNAGGSPSYEVELTFKCRRLVPA